MTWVVVIPFKGAPASKSRLSERFADADRHALALAFLADTVTAVRRADGAYHLDLRWVPPRTDGVITEYEVHLDGRLATSLVWGGTAPRDKAEYSFYVGRDPGVTYAVRIRARLPDGTWGGFSPEHRVTTGQGTATEP